MRKQEMAGIETRRGGRRAAGRRLLASAALACALLTWVAPAPRAASEQTTGQTAAPPASGKTAARQRRATSPAAKKQSSPSSRRPRAEAAAPPVASGAAAPPADAAAGSSGDKSSSVATQSGTKTTAGSGAATPETKAPAGSAEPKAAEGAKAEGAETEAAEGGEKEAAEAEPVGGVEGLRARAEAETDAVRRGRLRRELAEALVAEGQRAEAVELLRALAAEERFDPPHFFNAGNALARLGESRAAADAYRKAIAQRRGAYARAQHNLGVVLTRLGNWEEAEQALKTAVNLESSNYPEASYSLGRVYALRGEAGLAIAEWRRVLRLRPDHEGAVVALARALAEDGDTEGALEVLEDFELRSKRRGAEVPRGVAVARGEIVAAGNVESPSRARPRPAGETRDVEPASRVGGAPRGTPARGGAPRASAASPRLRPLAVGREAYDLLQRARAARAGGQREQAVTLYRRAAESNGGYFAPANIEMGYALGELRRAPEAAAALQVVTARDGARYPIVYYHLGRFAETSGRLEEAGAALERAAALLGDESPQFYVDLSRVREKQGRLAEALAAAENYLSRAERRGGAPDWGRALVAQLKEKAARASATK